MLAPSSCVFPPAFIFKTSFLIKNFRALSGILSISRVRRGSNRNLTLITRSLMTPHQFCCQRELSLNALSKVVPRLIEDLGPLPCFVHHTLLSPTELTSSSMGHFDFSITHCDLYNLCIYCTLRSLSWK